jgi:uncharacterized membrane protein
MKLKTQKRKYISMVYLQKQRSPFFFLLLFAVGAAGYFGIEVLFRGFSHWTMALCGGTCLCLIYATNRRLSRHSIVFRAAAGALIVTAIELAAGCFLNLYLHWNIWSYAKLPLNLWGQITPIFSALWFLLCIPVCFFCSLVDGCVIRRKRRIFTQNIE